MITAIKIDEENFKFYSLVHEQEEENKGYLDNLSKINIFIGENNSGKSRFLREFFYAKSLKYKQHLISENLIEKHEIYKKQVLDILNSYDSNIPEEVNEIMNKLRIESIPIESLREIEGLTDDLKVFLENKRFNDYSSSPFVIEGVSKISKEYLTDIKYILEESGGFNDRIYIPILRGLRNYEGIFNEDTPATSVQKDMYKWRTKKDYFKESDEKLNDRIFTGLGLYEDCKNLLLGAKKDRDKIRKFEEFLSECFFDGKDANLIPSIKDDILHVRIGNEEFPISQLGDGIQSVIILTYPLFFNQGKHMLFFFEEPEQCLHPAYQRVFMETLMRKEFDTFQYFFTTHSNHLLDITLEIDKVSIYTFKKTNDSMDNPTFEIENVDNENTDILRLIGVRNSSVFLSNCTIWVEGITDRIYMRKYLEVFQEEEIRKAKEEKRQITNYLEDIHYSFVEYGGNNITHWSFLEDDDNDDTILVDRLCGKLFLITDQDGAEEKEDGTTEKTAKINRFEKLEEKLGERYYCLKAREIENILATDVLKKVVKSYQPKDNTKLKFKKNFTYENYKKNEKIGEFINDNIIGCTRKGGYAAPSGTIKGNKAEFAKRAVKEINSINDLSEEARDLTEKLHDFISEQNKK
ncbi:AAA family ATPase [Bernardetia sp. OM2101]|uniref:AAA family ATPase n=1 Tax=Bernardetia sp. OM2101 TaxID=3344876 RepID=UPI0035D09BCA